ncbi:MAG: hypothetical protein P8189_21055, partial [Anaerolineae bacterium]
MSKRTRLVWIVAAWLLPLVGLVSLSGLGASVPVEAQLYAGPDATSGVRVPQAAVLQNAKTMVSNADEDGSGTVSLGDTLTYEFVATNAGDEPLTEVTIEDLLPGLSALSCDVAQQATLALGAALTCEATYEVTQGDVDAGGIDNTSTADSAETEAVDASESVVVAQN